MANYRNLLVVACIGTQLSGCMTQPSDSGPADPLQQPYAKLVQESQLESQIVLAERPKTVKKVTTSDKPEGLEVAAENDTDFWSDFNSQMGIAPHLDISSLGDEIAWLERHPNYIRNNIKRGAPILPFLLEEAQRRQLPAELALIPAIESTFNPRAVSPAGPTGLWQFTAETARHLGIKRNAHYDGRKDVVESTQAAFDYLELLNEKFGGNWLLTIAAYNCGPAVVERATRMPYDKVDIRALESLRIPSHTKSYVTKLMAMSVVVERQAGKPGGLPELRREDGFEIVEFRQTASLNQIASQAGLSLNDLSPYNTGLVRASTHPSAPQRILVRKQQAWKLAAVDWNRAQPVVATARTVEGYANGTQYTVKSGDTLTSLADRYGTSPSYLARVNGIANDLLRVGQVLRVPALNPARLAMKKPSL